MKKLKDNNLVESKDDTATRIMDAAEYLFAEKGFDGTTARDITSLAECNVASINYYFQGKDSLYLQVCKRRLNYLRDIRIQSINDYMAKDPKVRTLEGLLTAFSRAFMAPLIKETTGRNFMKLMVREMLYPQLPANLVFDELIIPMFAAMQSAMAGVCPGLTREQVMYSLHSLIAQLLHTIHVQGMFSDNPGELNHGFDADKAVEYIVAFTTVAIKSLLEG